MKLTKIQVLLISLIALTGGAFAVSASGGFDAVMDRLHGVQANEDVLSGTLEGEDIGEKTDSGDGSVMASNDTESVIDQEDSQFSPMIYGFVSSNDVNVDNSVYAWILLLGKIEPVGYTGNGARKYFIPGEVEFLVYNGGEVISLRDENSYYPDGMTFESKEAYKELHLRPGFYEDLSNRDRQNLVAVMTIDGKEVSSRTIGIEETAMMKIQNVKVSGNEVGVALKCGESDYTLADPYYLEITDKKTGETVYSEYFQPVTDFNGKYECPVVVMEGEHDSTAELDIVLRNYRIDGKMNSDG